MNRYCLLFLSLLISVSCKQVDDSKTQFLKWAQKGVVVDKVVCKNDANQNYCLYLPTNYDINKSYPVIYAFDPHGNGHNPVALMKNIAEKLGYIIIGSNNSRNGLRPDEINYIVSTLISDTQQKISINSNRIYMAGFSGGARVACAAALSIKETKGIIACSAGFQPNNNPLGFHFIGIAGTQDMNYLEVKRVDEMLKSFNIPSQLLVFKGKHQWPSEPVLDEAITMLELYAMKESLAQKNKIIIDEYQSSKSLRVRNLINSNSPDSLSQSLSILERSIDALDGLTNVDDMKSLLSEVKQNATLQNYLNEKQTIEKYEFEKQQEFATAFESKPDDWWKKEIAKLVESTNTSSENLKADVSKRLLGFISLNCYGYVNGALQYKDWKAADHFISIYQQVDPENPDSWYALACLQANTGKINEAILALNKAVHFGFTNYSKLRNDQLLNNLHNRPEFERLANQ